MRIWRSRLLTRTDGPETVAEPLRTQEVRPVIGVLVPNLGNSVFAECIEGMEEAARAAGYSLLVAFTNYDVDREEGTIASLISHGVSGLVLTVADANASGTLALLDRRRFPYTLVYNQVTNLPRSTVSVDNTKAACDLMHVLLDHGHRTVGMVVGSLHASDRSARRLEGYRAALKDRGVPPGPVVEIPFENIDEARLTVRLQDAMTELPRPTALFCSNDMLAMIVIRGLRKLDLSVPADVSVVGFDGIGVGQMLDPPLAGLVQPNRDLGATAVRHLCERITQKVAPTAIILDHQIRLGGTLARLLDD